MSLTKYNIDENDEQLKSLIECDHEKKKFLYLQKNI